MKKNFISIAIAILIIIGSGTGYFYFFKAHKAPALELSLINGNKFHLADFQQEYVLISFWATSCAICVSEIPEMKHFYNQYSGEKFELIAIAMPYDPPNRVLQMTTEKDIPYPIALDLQGHAMKGFGDVKITPTHFLLSRDGSIISTTQGKYDFSELEILMQQG